MVNLFRVIARHKQAGDSYDSLLAITQILMRNGWTMGARGKLIKKVKVQAPFQVPPAIYTVEKLKSGDLAVRDNTGKVHSKVDLSDGMTPAEILDAAKSLNQGAAVVRYRN